MHELLVKLIGSLSFSFLVSPTPAGHKNNPCHPILPKSGPSVRGKGGKKRKSIFLLIVDMPFPFSPVEKTFAVCQFTSSTFMPSSSLHSQ